MALKEKQRDGTTVLYPSGYFTGGTETDQIDERLSALLTDGTADVIVNLKDTQFLNSTALGTLLKAHIRYSKAGRKIRLCSVDKSIKQLFVITKLTMVFDVFENEDQAIAGS